MFKFKIINDNGLVFNIEFYLCVWWFIEKMDEGVSFEIMFGFMDILI